ncbi:multiple epidermal growth factor-like domains protein 11 isoform X4 [Pomacea canaliculata]|uniref:multiple epidermal growth factor-like domains protein 11 isoform X4 n=1 Tax=Pomacea canaliculata TaxID=400727 RepID=UPI000D73005F|nr:multiple epidermal growth factor-like domains protein 11 isoform X4 [Pomacea canaliculata]
MADCRCVQVFVFCVFTQIFLLCVAQNTHMKNVAQNKPCGTSSMYASSNNCSAALNGNTNTDYQENPPNCMHTGVYDTSPFWWVDLGEKVTINRITIYGRTPFINRMRCVNVSVDGALVKRFTDVSGWTNDTYTIPVLRGGRVVNITRDCDSLGPTINICEVQVWVCDDGWYDDCSKSCGQCDNNMSCDKVNGNCASCQTGFYPPLCQECADGYYQTDCSQTCGNCGSNSVCDKVTGRCTSCQTGFNLPFCKECADGWYGNDCSQTCGNCGSNSVCDKVTGRCTSCQTGFNPPYCKDVSSRPLITTLNTSSSVQATVTDYSSLLSTAGRSRDNDKETVSLAGPVAGAAVGCTVVFFIIGIILGWWLRKSRSKQPSARGHSPYEIPMTSDTGTSRSTSRPDDKVDTTHDYTNIGYTTNVYDSLKAPDDNNTTAYTSLDFHTDVHR